ncbi:DUF1513 domain-containing protein [Sulfitobacter sp. SK012]|nr:DUF1513 domain-containing protein [Sulfitobacter sp. SK012]
MPNRRGFLAGLAAASLIPHPTWADAGSPAYLSAAATQDGSYLLCGIAADLTVLFQIPLPDRGHAAAAHPSKPEVVAFARRPGTFAVVIDCTTQTETARLMAPLGRHFYGHGAFSEDGNWLFTTENDYEAGQGCIGVWDVAAGYVRSAEFPSGGIGPHDIKRLPGTDTLVIANGGIDTHPDSGRTKLNIATMRPNLTYVDAGVVIETAELAPDLQKNSIRHLAVSAKGMVAFGMQWQGDTDVIGLVGTHRMGQSVRILQAPQEQVRSMQGYVGSIAFKADDKTVAATSPRGGSVHMFNAETGGFSHSHHLVDVSGVAPNEDGFVITSGLGVLQKIGNRTKPLRAQQDLLWDNHLIAVETAKL